MTGETDPRIGIAGSADLTALAPLLASADAKLPPGLGGTWTTEFIHSMAARGIRVTLFTLDFTVDRPQRFAGPLLTVHVGPFRRRHRMRDLMAVERAAIAAMIRSDPPDIVGAQFCYEYALGALASGVPTVVSAHDWAPAILRSSLDLYRLGRLILFGMALRRSAHLTALTPDLAARIERATRRACPVVPGGVRVAAAPAQAAPGDPPRLLAINNGFSRRKNVGTLLQAFALVRRRVPDARLELLGDGHEPGGAAEAWARLRNLVAGVRFVGRVPHADIAQWIARATLMVHPAVEEALGFVLLEALAGGLPVIAGHAAAGPRWILEEDGTGLLADSRSPSALADAVLALLADPARRAALGAAGQAMVRRRFDQDANAALYLAHLRRIAATVGGTGVRRRESSGA